MLSILLIFAEWQNEPKTVPLCGVHNLHIASYTRMQYLEGFGLALPMLTGKLPTIDLLETSQLIGKRFQQNE